MKDKHKKAKFLKAIQREGLRFLRDHNINSVGIGHKRMNGKITDIPCMQFTVQQKIQLETLDSVNTIEIPKTITVDGLEIPTDVISRQFIPHHTIVEAEAKDFRLTKVDKLTPGISVSNENGTAGTIGCFVYDRRGTPCILSNWHVLHGIEGKVNDPIVQPGAFDFTPDGTTQIGILLRSHLGEAGDCAIASIDSRMLSPEIHGLGVIPKRLAEVDLGDKVIKSGRTTGITRGCVTRINVFSKVDYGGTIGEKEIGCFEISLDPNDPNRTEEISRQGDSGAAWIIEDEDGNPSDILAGIHFAGEDRYSTEEFALACYAPAVFKKLEISLTSTF